MSNPFIYTQTERQCFFFFPAIEGVGTGDFIGAFNGDVCVGFKECNFVEGNGYVEIPAMGSVEDDGFLEVGDEVTFKLYLAATDEILDLDVISATMNMNAIDNMLFEDNGIYTIVEWAIVTPFPEEDDDDEDWYVLNVNGSTFVFRGHILEWHEAMTFGS